MTRAPLPKPAYDSFDVDPRLDHLAALIREHREAAGLSARDVAEAAGIQFAHLYKFEQGRPRALSVASLLRVLQVLGLELSAQPSRRKRRR